MIIKPVIVREANSKRFSIEGAVKHVYPEIKVEIQIHEESRTILVWRGNRKTPVTYARYAGDKKFFDDAVSTEIRIAENEVKNVKDYEAECILKCENILKNVGIGDVFYASWGWEQTNIDYYQVVECKGKKYGFKKLKSVNVEYDSHTMQGKSLPSIDNFASDEIISKNLSKHGLFVIDSVRDIKPLNYDLVNGVKVYESKSFSCYG